MFVLDLIGKEPLSYTGVTVVDGQYPCWVFVLVLVGVKSYKVIVDVDVMLGVKLFDDWAHGSWGKSTSQ